MSKIISLAVKLGSKKSLGIKMSNEFSWNIFMEFIRYITTFF